MFDDLDIEIFNNEDNCMKFKKIVLEKTIRSLTDDFNSGNGQIKIEDYQSSYLNNLLSCLKYFNNLFLRDRLLLNNLIYFCSGETDFERNFNKNIDEIFEDNNITSFSLYYN